MYAAIEAGDAALAERLAREHYGHPHRPTWGKALDAELVIDVAHLRAF